MLTRPGWAVLVGSLLTIAVGRVLGLPELFLLGAIGVAVVAGALLLVRRRPPDLDAERVVHPRRVHLGGPSRVELRVANRGTGRTPVLTLHDPVEGTIGARVALAPLAPGAHQAASYRLPTERRGLVRVGPLEAELTDAFGLARRRVVVAGEAVLTVLPAIERLAGLVSGTGLDDPLTGAARPVAGASGDEDFATLRPYVVGDDLRRVHWASSARAGDLLVRQDDPPWQGHLTVLLDARANRLDADAFELAVSAAASLLHAVSRRGDRARLVITDGTDTGLLDARAGRDTLLEHLAVVVRHQGSELPSPALDGQRRAGGLVVVSGVPTPGDLARVAAERSRFGTVRLVAVHPTATGPRPATLPGDGPDRAAIVHVDATHPFGPAWQAALRRRPRP